MNIKEWLDKVAHQTVMQIGPEYEPLSKVYISKFDDSYITRVGMEGNVRFLAEREITEELTHGVGFSPLDSKWYGWSHRAIYGFKVGSTCKKGDCHYTPKTPEDLIDEHANFFLDISQESVDRHRTECHILDDRSGIRILHTPVVIPLANSIDDLVDALDGEVSALESIDIMDGFSVIECGRGEWVAKTMDDAKQMAVDFNRGVS
jgi:hypothetical protein